MKPQLEEPLSAELRFKMTEWFESWFNTDEYVEVYKHRNEPEAKKHVEFILEHSKVLPGSSILDMACGTGRHSLIFAEKGFDVTSVDLSDNLLCMASKSAAELNLQINFIKSDLRDIQLDQKFDLALNLFTSFGYFEEDDDNFRIFDVALKHLKENGKFVIDFFNKNYLLKNLCEYSESSVLGRKIIQHRSVSGERVIKKIEIKSADTDKFFYESVRLFSPVELIEGLNNRGLFVDRIFGDFQGNSFDPDKSERIIIFAVR
jgi:2-polyprenyl-3-methyl-5-hydroxy-6-metoxy-1,4-benzoquinol methylase